MPQHIAHTCHDDCNGCHICNGGLFHCKICNGAEGSLPTECPGESMRYEEEVAVYDGTLDFKDGQWVPEPLTLQAD